MSEDMQQTKSWEAERRAMYPLCRDCVHVTGLLPDGTLTDYECGLTQAHCLRERDLVDGNPVTCRFMRSHYGGCQVPGWLFERKP